jgi:MEMO1 family protein
MKKYFTILPLVFLLFGSMGYLLGGFGVRSEESASEITWDDSDSILYSSGFERKAFFDAAYEKAERESGVPSVSRESREITTAIVAHHLLVADKIAEVFIEIGSSDIETIVLLSPNHFSGGISSAQISKGTWQTPYGELRPDDEKVEKLLDVVSILSHEELAFEYEHGIGVVTPFIKRSFPEADFLPIILDESLSFEAAHALGESIARLFPDAVVISSIDMVHRQTSEVTSENDVIILSSIEAGGLCSGAWCDEELLIDSNASMQTLFAVNATRGISSWNLVHHGSSLSMGATKNPDDNVSHILGYFW